MRTQVVWSLALVWLLQGCASQGFNRGALENLIGVKKPVTEDADIKTILERKANLPRPFSLAVYFKQPVADKTNAEFGGKIKWRWSDQDKDLILSAVSDLRGKKLISDVFPVLPSTTDGEDLKSIRIAAAKHGADAVLVVDGAGQVDRYINNWGWSYILLVTTAFVPGSEADTLFMSSASMWDVRNEYLYLSAEAEGKTSNRHIALFGDRDEQLLEKAKTDSLKCLSAEVTKMINGIKK